jgi:hypothetical protein
MINISDDMMRMETRTIHTCFYYQRFFLIILLLLCELTSHCQGIVEFILSFQRVEVRIIKKSKSVNFV